MNGVGAGHNHGLASKLMKRNAPLKHNTPARAKVKKSTQNVIKSTSVGNGVILNRNESRLKAQSDSVDLVTISRQASEDRVDPVGGFAHDSREISHSSSHSRQSQFSIRPNEAGSSLESDTDFDEKKIFTVENELNIPNGIINQNSSLKYLPPDRGGTIQSSGSQTSSNLYENVRRKPTYERPYSSTSLRRENTMKGPTYYYKAKETYFDCEFYIFGHKYQSKF